LDLVIYQQQLVLIHNSVINKEEGTMLETESGMSLLGSLSVRPSLNNLLGAGVEGPKHIITPVLYNGRMGESAVPTSFFTDLVCKVSLPVSYNGVNVGGCEASVLIFDCDHHIKTEDIARELQKRVKDIAERHYRSLAKETRRKERLTSMDQWQIVKRSLERVLFMHICKPADFEISAIALGNILTANLNISLVLINSINTFYHQESVKTGIFHNPYIRSLLTHIVEATQYMHKNLKVLYTQLNYFNKEDNFYNINNPRDKLFVIKDNIRLGPPDPSGSYYVYYNTARVLTNLL